MAEDLTRDRFLGGRLTILQPRRGYRAGIEPVLLAASVPAEAGQTVLELGLGAGVASLCLAARVPGLALSGLELQSDYADLARRNAAANGHVLEVVVGSVAERPRALGGRQFDHVMANPPFFDHHDASRAADPGRAVGRSGEPGLAVWTGFAARRLRPGGTLTLIHRAERLPALLAALGGGFGGIEIKPVAPRADRAATLVLLRAAKGSRAPARLHAPLVLHSGARHERDGEDYRPEVQVLLRQGGPLTFASGPTPETAGAR